MSCFPPHHPIVWYVRVVWSVAMWCLCMFPMYNGYECRWEVSYWRLDAHNAGLLDHNRHIVVQAQQEDSVHVVSTGQYAKGFVINEVTVRTDPRRKLSAVIDSLTLWGSEAGPHSVEPEHRERQVTNLKPGAPLADAVRHLVGRELGAGRVTNPVLFGPPDREDLVTNPEGLAPSAAGGYAEVCEHVGCVCEVEACSVLSCSDLPLTRWRRIPFSAAAICFSFFFFCNPHVYTLS